MVKQSSIVLNNDRRLPQLKAQRKRILDIGHQHGALTLRLFGSVARGEDGPSSDVDFLVEMEPGRTLFDLGELQVDLAQALGCKVDVVTPNGLRYRVRDEVLREAQPLWVFVTMPAAEQIVGEAAARISDSHKSAHPEIQWKAITGIRNILVHGYFGIDLDIVWQAVERDLPVLKQQLMDLVN